LYLELKERKENKRSHEKKIKENKEKDP